MFEKCKGLDLFVTEAMTISIYRLRDDLGKQLDTEIIIDEEISNKWGLARGTGVMDHMELSLINFIKDRENMCG